MAELRVHREAREELLEKIAYYEDEAGRGEDFASAVEEAYAWISTTPMSFPPTRGTRAVRSTRVRGYPYRVYYEARKESVLVVAIAHERRDPDYWKMRLGG